MQIDVRGLSCPLPVMHTKKALESAPSSLVVLVTSGTAKANVANLLRDEGFAVHVMDGDGEFRIEARRA